MIVSIVEELDNEGQWASGITQSQFVQLNK